MERKAEIKKTKYNSDPSQNEANSVAQIPATNPLNLSVCKIHVNKPVTHYLIKNLIFS